MNDITVNFPNHFVVECNVCTSFMNYSSKGEIIFMNK